MMTDQDTVLTSTLKDPSEALYAVCRNEDAVALDLPRESDADTALTAAAPLAIACFRGRSTVSVLVSKQECLILQVRPTSGDTSRHSAFAASWARTQSDRDRLLHRPHLLLPIVSDGHRQLSAGHRACRQNMTCKFPCQRGSATSSLC
jgi:hypothetical protein